MSMDKKLVVDSSVLIVLNGRGTLEEHLRRRRDEGYEVLIPRAIAREIVNEPKKYAEEIKERSPALATKILNSVERVASSTKALPVEGRFINVSKNMFRTICISC